MDGQFGDLVVDGLEPLAAAAMLLDGRADGFGVLRVVVASVGAALGEGVAGGADGLHCVAVLLEQVFGTGAVQVDGRFGHGG